MLLVASPPPTLIGCLRFVELLWTQGAVECPLEFVEVQFLSPRKFVGWIVIGVNVFWNWEEILFPCQRDHSRSDVFHVWET